MNKLFTLAGPLALALGALLLMPAAPVAPALSGAAFAQETDADVAAEAPLVREMTLGDPDAPLTVIEYASATCPHCATFHLGTFPQVKQDYVETGKVHFVYREVYFDRFGLWAGMVARCGTPAGELDDAQQQAATRRYFAIMNMVFDQQKQWLDADSPAGIAENLSKIGRTAGLTSDQVDACLQDAAMAEQMVELYQQNVEADDVSSTPSFIIDGELHSGAMGFDEFSALLDAALPAE